MLYLTEAAPAEEAGLLRKTFPNMYIRNAIGR